MKIAWIGTGVMGSYMVRHIKAAGHEVSCYNRTKEKYCYWKRMGFLFAIRFRIV